MDACVHVAVKVRFQGVHGECRLVGWPSTSPVHDAGAYAALIEPADDVLEYLAAP
jgi:hypothetical protein